MQSSSVTFSPSLPLLKPRRPHTSFFSSGCNSIRSSSSSSSNSRDLSDLNNVSLPSSWPRRSWTLSTSPFSSSKLRPWTGVPSFASDFDANHFKVQAAAVPESSEEAASAGGNLMKTLELGLLFGLWYLFNIYFNIYNKQVRYILFSSLNFYGVCIFCGRLLEFVVTLNRFAWNACIASNRALIMRRMWIQERKLVSCMLKLSCKIRSIYYIQYLSRSIFLSEDLSRRPAYEILAPNFPIRFRYFHISTR